MQDNEAADIGMVRRNATGHPQATQIEARQPFQFTQGMHALHDAIQDQADHQLWRIGSAASVVQ